MGAGGRIYTGQWQNGHMAGSGRMDFPDGSRCEGEHEMDVKSGEGTFMWADGRTYRGQWNDGKQDGAGCTIDANGVMSRGTWKNGVRVDPSDATARSGRSASKHYRS